MVRNTTKTEGVKETTSFQRLYYISPEHFDVSLSVLKLNKCAKKQIKNAQTTYKMRLTPGPYSNVVTKKILTI